MADPWSGLLGFVLTLMLHASALLGAVWALERIGWLRNPAHAEAAWRGALFGSLLTALIASAMPAVWRAGDRDANLTAATTSASTVKGYGRSAIGFDVPPSVVTPAVRNEARPNTAHPATPASAPTLHADPTAVHGVNAAGASTESVRSPLALPESVVRALALVWLAATLAWLALTALRLHALRRLQRKARQCPAITSPQQEQADALCARLGLAAVTLHRVATLASPVVLPDRRVLLPEWSVQLPPAASRALLAHELAHLARNDPYWRIAQHLALAPLSLNPLAWIALRRLESLAERRADALAARMLGDGRVLAECLAYCLAQHLARSATTPRFALAMAERPGAVVDRVQHLLEDDPMTADLPSPRRTRLAIALGLLACLSLPSIVVVAFADGLRSGESVSIHVDENGNETVDIAIRRRGYVLEVEMEGKIQFAADESDVIGMAPDAKLEIEETRDGASRSLIVSPADRGTSRAYKVDGTAQDFDAEARAWLAQTLPDLFRNTAIDAEARARRILAHAGTDGLIAEIERIRSDHGRARYLGLLFTHATPDATQLTRTLELLRGIKSDYELRRAITLVLDARTLDASQQLRVLDLAQAIGSDYERAQLLVDTATRFSHDATTLAHWAKALDGVGSDYERRRALEALLGRVKDDAAAVRLAFNAARKLGSDHEKRQLLERGLAAAHANSELRDLYLAVARGIGSDHERKQALLALLRGAQVDTSFALNLIDASEGIGSDHERGRTLVEIAARMPADAAVIERYRAAARRLSPHERGQVEAALARLVVVR